MSSGELKSACDAILERVMSVVTPESVAVPEGERAA